MYRNDLTPDETRYAGQTGFHGEVYPSYDENDYDENGYDRDGYDRDGYDFDGYTVNGIHRDGHYDRRHDEIERLERMSVYLDPDED